MCCTLLILENYLKYMSKYTFRNFMKVYLPLVRSLSASTKQANRAPQYRVGYWRRETKKNRNEKQWYLSNSVMIQSVIQLEIASSTECCKPLTVYLCLSRVEDRKRWWKLQSEMSKSTSRTWGSCCNKRFLSAANDPVEYIERENKNIRTKSSPKFETILEVVSMPS